MRKIIVAIDGPAGSGKSTVAKALARKLKIPYIDTGAMYRAITYLAIQNNIPLDKTSRLVRLTREARLAFKSRLRGPSRVMSGRQDISREIRNPKLTERVHHIASNAKVRKELVRLQRKMADVKGGVVEGRDIGTVVFPKTPYKFYLDADIKKRALRRYRELKKKGHRSTLAQVTADQVKRDRRDMRRKVSPLRKAPDAKYLDTTQLTIPQVVGRIAKSIMGGNSSIPAQSRRK